MVRSVLTVSGCLVAFVVLRVPAAGQATVEAGMGAAASSIGSSGARGVNKSIGGVFRNLDEALKPTGSAGAAKTDSPPPARSTKPAARRKPTGQTSRVREEGTDAVARPTPSYEDATRIEKGMGQEELLRRFGPPAMQIASGSDAQTMSYISGGGVVQLELQAGTVISVAKPKAAPGVPAVTDAKAKS